MSIDDIMQSFDAIILLAFMVFIGISAILLIPDLIEQSIRRRYEKKQQAIEQQDRLARPEHWAEIDAQRAHPPGTETITQVKQRLRAVQARYANAHLQQGDEKHYIIDAPNIFDVTVPETAAYLDAVAHAERLLDGSTNDAATADTATTEAVTAVEDAWEKMVSVALQVEQPWPVVIEKTPLEDTDVIRAMQQQHHQQHTEIDAAVTRTDDAAQSMQQAVMQPSLDADQQQQTPRQR